MKHEAELQNASIITTGEVDSEAANNSVLSPDSDGQVVATETDASVDTTGSTEVPGDTPTSSEAVEETAATDEPPSG